MELTRLVYVTVFVRVCPNAVKFANMSWAEKLKFKAGQIDLCKQVFVWCSRGIIYLAIGSGMDYSFHTLVEKDWTICHSIGWVVVSRNTEPQRTTGLPAASRTFDGDN